MEWNEALKNLKERLGCTSSELAHILEVSVPVMTSWMKGYDSKGNVTTPTYAYAAIIRQALKIDDAQLKNAFKKALKRPRMNSKKLTTNGDSKINATRNISYNDLTANEPSSLQTFIESIYLD